MSCSTPDCTKEKVFARGLCQGCYYRLRRNGSVQRRNVVNSGSCSVEGCVKKAFAKNMCQSHYTQAQHPMNHTWRILRSRYPGDYPPGWDRFETFLSEVGERPTPRHQLRREDAAQPWGASNFRWTQPVGKGSDYYTKEERSDYEKAWRFRRDFKTTPERVEQIRAAQGGVCAICGGVETHIYKSGKLRDLSVDHDHVSGAVRGLLCVNCNRGIGYLKDSPALLRAAAEYIEGHAAAGQSANAQRAIVCDAPSAET